MAAEEAHEEEAAGGVALGAALEGRRRLLDVAGAEAEYLAAEVGLRKKKNFFPFFLSFC